ncbi:hypothetical protein LR48_Vigan406s018000 [Vigna angularis]|uniref:Uncharacterized protein n=1 Tax=Phaseolus angularis TaxID=3914 RepID=A0A0L9T9T1_PHAAN|nr:hypothetical protein LR48_Vigan406s018000 [Vigna angularis]
MVLKLKSEKKMRSCSRGKVTGFREKLEKMRSLSSEEGDEWCRKKQNAELVALGKLWMAVSTKNPKYQPSKL